MPVLILRIASAAPEKIRMFHKVLLKLEQALSGSIKAQHPPLQPKGARPIKLTSPWNAWQGTSRSHEPSLKIGLFALAFQLWKQNYGIFTVFWPRNYKYWKSTIFSTLQDNQASFWQILPLTNSHVCWNRYIFSSPSPYFSNKTPPIWFKNFQATYSEYHNHNFAASQVSLSPTLPQK